MDVASGSGMNGETRRRRRKTDRPFDWSKWTKQHVALKVSYLGWEYDGFVVQDNSDKTIEDALFTALVKTRLIESRETSNYHRCGRTDKGVSAFGQVISLDLRAKPDDPTALDYPTLLSRVLPDAIRVTAWAVVPDEFSARFSCTGRVYRYLFPRACLDLSAMRQAAAFLVGESLDLRNFCKIDPGKNATAHTKRTITAADVELVDGSAGARADNPFAMCVLKIAAPAFLWHQIRCIATVLLLVGQGLEQPSVVRQLLDQRVCQARPQYFFAADFSLNLFDCEFDNLEWRYEQQNIRYIRRLWQRQWTEHAVKAAMLQDMLTSSIQWLAEGSEEEQPSTSDLNRQADCLLNGEMERPRANYKRLLDRPRCDSLEVKKAKLEAKGKGNGDADGQSSMDV